MFDVSVQSPTKKYFLENCTWDPNKNSIEIWRMKRKKFLRSANWWFIECPIFLWYTRQSGGKSIAINKNVIKFAFFYIHSNSLHAYNFKCSCSVYKLRCIHMWEIYICFLSKEERERGERLTDEWHNYLYIYLFNKKSNKLFSAHFWDPVKFAS